LECGDLSPLCLSGTGSEKGPAAVLNWIKSQIQKSAILNSFLVEGVIEQQSRAGRNNQNGTPRVSVPKAHNVTAQGNAF